MAIQIKRVQTVLSLAQLLDSDDAQPPLQLNLVVADCPGRSLPAYCFAAAPGASKLRYRRASSTSALTVIVPDMDREDR